MLKLAIIYGGHPSEHDVSVSSFKNIYSQINKESYEITVIYISKSGGWFLQQDHESTCTQHDECIVSAQAGSGLYVKEAKLPIDVAFLCLHGKFGEDGTIQGLLELCKIKYTGCEVLGSAVSMNKIATKTIATALEIPIVPYMHFSKKDLTFIDSQPQFVLPKLLSLGFPLFLKPASLGSSVGCMKLDDKTFVINALKDAIIYYDEVIIEKFIECRELECSVIEDMNHKLHTPSVGEIVVNKQKHTFYDYSSKYSTDGATTTATATISDVTKEKIQEYAKKIFAGCFCKGFARVDFLLDVHNDRIYLSEINTIPGMTPTSLFSQMASQMFTYPKLLDHIIAFAMLTH